MATNNSVTVQVADAMVAELNAGPFDPALGATRLYRPEFDLAQLKTTQVTLVPKKIEITNIARNANQYDVSIDVAVQKKVDLANQADLDGLMALVEQIGEFFRLRRLTLAGGGSALWAKTENDPIFAPEHLETKQVFTSVLTLTFKVTR